MACFINNLFAILPYPILVISTTTKDNTKLLPVMMKLFHKETKHG